jgi:hypothetical protein
MQKLSASQAYMTGWVPFDPESSNLWGWFVIFNECKRLGMNYPFIVLQENE